MSSVALAPPICTKAIYNLADMILMKITVDVNKTPFAVRLTGKLSWSPPWGGSINLVRDTAAVCTVGGFPAALLALRGDVVLFVASDAASDYFAVVDGRGLQSFSLPADATDIPSLLFSLGKARLATYSRVAGSKAGAWTTIMTAK